MQSNHVWLNATSSSSLPRRSAAVAFRLVLLSLIPCGVLSTPHWAYSQAVPGSTSQVAALESSSLEALVVQDEIAPPAQIAGAASNALAALDTVPAPSGFLAPESPAFGAGQSGMETKARPHVDSELIIEGMMSYGNYKIFASGYDERLYTAGVEYDRHSWGYFLKAQVDYAAEILPFVLLNKPTFTDIWGNPKQPIAKYKNIRENVPGLSISPIGFRMLWRGEKVFQPYIEAKGGIIAFTKKVPSSQATYENFSLESGTGVQVKMSDRWGLRLGLFGDFHFSNAFMVPVDPGLDVMNANLGLSYHF